RLRHRHDGAGDAAVGRWRDAGAGIGVVIVDHPDCRKPEFVQRPAGIRVHRAVCVALRLRDSSAGVARRAPRPRVGLRISRPQPHYPIHGVELCPANTPRVRHGGIRCARTSRNAAARRGGRGASVRRAARPGMGHPLRADRRRGRICRRAAQHPAIPHHPPLSQLRSAGADGALAGACGMEVIQAFVAQGAQMALVLLLAPLLTGVVRKLKARLTRRRGASVIQPYRDLLRLLRKDVVLAENASWLFRVVPYLVFAAIWVAASLVPTFAAGLIFSGSADLIALIALLGSARFFLALAGMDVGTSFGGIGSSREMMIASLAEPAMIMVVFTLALVAGSTQLSYIAGLFASSGVGLRVSLGLALIALVM